MEELKGALAVLDGKSPGVGSDTALGKGEIKLGTTFLLRATDLTEAAAQAKCAAAKYIEAVRISMGENEGESFFRAQVLTTSKEHAHELREVVEGLKALAIWHVGDDAAARPLVDALKITTKGKWVNIKWKAPADEVWKMVEKHAEWLAKHHGMMGWPGHKPAEGAKQGGSISSTATVLPRGPTAGMPGFPDFFKNLNLSDAQKAKLADLRKEYEPKFKANHEKMESILTAEQKKARDEAVKAAIAAGKKGKEIFDAAGAAMKLTDDQKTKMADAWKQAGALFKEFGEKFRAFLTPEQKEKLDKMRPPKPEKKPAGK